MTKRNLHCHKLIAETAKGMAGEMYEQLMRNNAQYAEWKRQCPELTPEKLEVMFIAQMWPHLIEQARATLASMLTGNYPENLKEQISDALIKDNMLRRGRRRGIAQAISGPH